MIKSSVKKLKNKYSICLIFITLLGGLIRLKACFWGHPLLLHPDEFAIVDWAVEMLSRHSWEAHSFFRPDHFEIKCVAILFSIASWLRYHVPAYEAFEIHRTFFYIIARAYTALFGTAMIPLTYTLTKRCMRGFKYRDVLGLLAAVQVSFGMIFIKHSGYATPDIVLSFFIMLFGYFMLEYIENVSNKSLYICMIIIGIGMTIKYPAAILCIPLAIMVIYRKLIEKEPIQIIKLGIISIVVIIATVFVLAPNLITDFGSVLYNIVAEATPNHLGADGLGFWGNLRYYFSVAMNNFGVLTTIFVIIGFLNTIYIYARDKKGNSLLLVPMIYWICISVLALHWERWGIPMYPFFIICEMMGFRALFEFVSRIKEEKNKFVYRCVKAFISVSILLILFNSVVQGFSMAKFYTLPDTRLVALEYVNANGINMDNSVYEVYTPFDPSGFENFDGWEISGNSIKVSEEYSDKEYFIMSDNLKNRFFADPDRYKEQCRKYTLIDDTFPLIYSAEADGNYICNKYVIGNIVHSISYLLNECTATGNAIFVYQLQ